MSKEQFDPSDPMNLVDEVLNQHLSKVNWQTITLNESQSFSVSLGMLYNAELFRRESQATVVHGMWLLISALVVFCVGKMFALSPSAILTGVGALLMINFGNGMLLRRLGQANVKTQRTALIEDIQELSRRHPLETEQEEL